MQLPKEQEREWLRLKLDDLEQEREWLRLRTQLDPSMLITGSRLGRRTLLRDVSLMHGPLRHLAGTRLLGTVACAGGAGAYNEASNYGPL